MLPFQCMKEGIKFSENSRFINIPWKIMDFLSEFIPYCGTECFAAELPGTFTQMVSELLITVFMPGKAYHVGTTG